MFDYSLDLTKKKSNNNLQCNTCMEVDSYIIQCAHIHLVVATFAMHVKFD